MKDTSLVIEKKMVELMKMRSNLDRLKMGAEMFDTAKALIRTVLNKMPESELHLNLFLRFYGNEFDQCRKERIMRALSRKP